eukprot:5993634-Alexandrium_andersonii.AAC.1
MAPLQVMLPKPAARPVDEPFGLRSGAARWHEPGVFGGPSYFKVSGRGSAVSYTHLRAHETSAHL